MVDFQERDTRRTLDGDVEGDGESEDAASTEEAAEHRAGSGTVTGHDGDEPAGSSGGEDVGSTSDEHAAGTEAGHDAGHDHHAEDLDSVSAAVLTISTSRTIDEDGSGDTIVEVLEGEGHSVATREIVNDDYDGVQSAVDALVSRQDVDAVVTTGGTGVAPEDVTPEAVRPLFEKELPGFGELFRARSHDEIGTRAIGTRAIAGVAEGVPVFCLPGSEDAVRLGVATVVEPEIGHLAGLSRPHETEE